MNIAIRRVTGSTVSLGISADPWYGTIFLFLAQIAPSCRHISTLVSWFLAWMLSRCRIKYWELLDYLADFSQPRQGIRNQGSSMYSYAPSYERVSFQGRKILWFRAVNKQLLDEVEHDIMNYQNRGLCYRLRQITQTRGFDNSWYHAKTEFNNRFIIHFSHNLSSETEAKRSAILVSEENTPRRLVTRLTLNLTW